MAASDGLADFTGLTIDKPGMGYTMVFSSPGLRSFTFGPFDVHTTVDMLGVGWGSRSGRRWQPRTTA